MLGLTPSDLTKIIDTEQNEVKRRQVLYQQGAELPSLTGRTVILVDDGVATGVTTRAAIQGIKVLKPSKLILAIPVGPLDTLQSLKKLVDELIYLDSPSPFYAVGAFYDSFPQVSDAEVINLLKRAREWRTDHEPSTPKS